MSKKFLNAIIAAAIGGALSGVAESIGDDKEIKHIGKAATVGAIVTVVAFLKNSSPDENPGDDDEPTHSHEKEK